MIGYNEYQEAVNLLNLLYESQEKLHVFNDVCGNCRLEQARGAEAGWTAIVQAQAQLEELTAWEKERRLSGLYALCFSDAAEVQRKPYDLLARLAPRPEETEEALLSDSLLKGLSKPDKARARRLYQRLMHIQPMRLLLARLHQLEPVLEEEGAERLQAYVKIVTREGFLDAIPLFMERKSGQSLDMRGNNFTILDRLMDNWDRPLRQDEGFRMPAKAFDYTFCARSLLTVGVAHSLCGGEAENGPYRAIPGGHIALGVYDGSTKPDTFFKAVTRIMRQKGPRLLNIHGYAGTQLVQMTYGAAECFRAEVSSADFQGKDDGGQNLLVALADAATKRQLQKEGHLPGFVKGTLASEAQRISAVDELQQVVLDCFGQEKLPDKASGEITRVKNVTEKMKARLVGLLTACEAGYGVCRMPCPRGAAPGPVLELLDRMRSDPEECAKFWQRVERMQADGARLDLRYIGEGDTRTLCVLCEEENRWALHRKWLDSFSAAASAGRLGELSVPPFDVDALREIILAGMRRFLHFRSSVGTGNAEIRVAATKRVRHKDIYFQMFCLWCVHVCNGGEAVLMQPDENDLKKTAFKTRNGRLGFVDMFARTDAEATGTQLTPAKFRTFLQQVVGRTLKIEADGVVGFRITV